ncbi:IS630 family transposase [Saccharopolyspora taberi]|uniref:IS630 family transposase n=1 Tax=Saccharopolyspora taberi TaxID=60895 RepID=A0ABN3VG20_9PSEU
MTDTRGPKLAPLELTDQELETLEALARGGKTAQALALRARIVLACAEGLSNSEVSRRLGVSLPTVGKWRRRFLADRIGGLDDEPRPGAPRTITAAQVELVVTKTLREQPEGRGGPWSTRSMAEATGMSQTAISRIWREFGLEPHLADAWQMITDPLRVDGVRDVVGICIDPPKKALILAADRKSAEHVPPPERTTRGPDRHGTAFLIAALDEAGKVIGPRSNRHRAFVRFLKAIDTRVQPELDLHLVCDNHGTQMHPTVRKWLLEHPRFHLHFTPTSAGWLSLVQRLFAEVSAADR